MSDSSNLTVYFHGPNNLLVAVCTFWVHGYTLRNSKFDFECADYKSDRLLQLMVSHHSINLPDLEHGTLVCRHLHIN